MFPRARAAGVAGIVAGIGLAIEFALFMASGWSPEVFTEPASDRCRDTAGVPRRPPLHARIGADRGLPCVGRAAALAR